MARYHTLILGIRYRVVAKYTGYLLLSLGAMLLVPLAVSVATGADERAFRFAGAMAALFALGLPSLRLSAPREIGANEAMVVLALLFIGASAIVAWPLAGDGLSWEDALFESVSAVTTTGLTTLVDLDTRHPAFLFARAWLQWYWGLVIVVLAVALILQPGPVAKRLVGTDTGPEDLIGSTRTRAIRSFTVYAMLTVTGICLLLLLGMSPFDALLYVLGAVSTGGFAPYDRSLAAPSGWAAQAVVIALCLAAAVSFATYERARLKGPRAIWGDTEVRTLILAAAATTVLLALTMAGSGLYDWRSVVMNAPLVAVSAQSTAGFTTLSLAGIDQGSKLVLILSMFIGGDAGSTAGGIKIVRLLVLLRLLQLVFLRARLPGHAVVAVSVGGRPLSHEQIQIGLGIVFLHAATIVAIWSLFLLNGHAPLDALFDVVSAVSTTGLSVGITAPQLETPLKMALCAGMLLGRLEIVAILLLLFPSTWIGRKAETR